MGNANHDTTADAQNGATKAQNIETLYYKSGAHAAEAALRSDYLAATDQHSQAALQAEMTRLQTDSATTHLLPHLALDWATPLAKDDRLTAGRLQDYQNHTGSQSDAFDAAMAGQVQNQYADLTKGWQGHLFPWEKGINSNDLTTAANADDAGRVNQDFAAMLRANNGALFTKLSGVNDLDSTTLDKALKADADAKAHGQPTIFTDDQRAIAQHVLDHWDDKTTQAMMNPDNDTNPNDTADAISRNSLNRALPAAGDAAAAAAVPANTTDTSDAAAGHNAAAAQGADNTPGAKVTVQKGEGYWDIAAQELGLESRDSNISLSSRRNTMNQTPLNAAQRQQMVALIKELEASGRRPEATQDFNFTVTDGVVHYQAPASGNS